MNSIDLFTKENSLLNTVLEEICIYKNSSSELEISLLFTNFPKGSKFFKVNFIFNKIKEFHFFHSKDYIFYNVENFKFLEKEGFFYLCLDPDNRNEDISDNDLDYILAGEFSFKEIQ